MEPGQLQFNFATDLEKLLKAGPKHLETMGIGYGGFSWWHHLGSLMIVACLSELEASLGKQAWRDYKIHVEEFEVLRHIRNAYVHTASDLSKLNDANAMAQVVALLKMLKNEEILGIKGQKIEPYFSLNGSVVQVEGNAVRRTRSLYLQLVIAAGNIKA